LEDAGKVVAVDVSCFLRVVIWTIRDRLFLQRIPDGERGAHSRLDPGAAGGFYSVWIWARYPGAGAR